MIRRRPAAPRRAVSPGVSCSRWRDDGQAGDVFLGHDHAGIADGLGQRARSAADHATPCAMASSAARGVTSIHRGVVREGHHDAIEPRPDLVDAAAGQGAEPRHPAGDAEPPGQPLQLLLGRPVPTTVMFHRPTSFTQARNSRSSPFSGISRPTNPIESPTWVGAVAC